MRQKKKKGLTYKHRTRILKFTQSHSSLNISWKIWIFIRNKMPVPIQTTLVGHRSHQHLVPPSRKARPRETQKARNMQSQSRKKGAKSTCRWSLWQSFPVSWQTNLNARGVFTTSDRSRHRRSILWPWLKGHSASQALSIEFSQAHFQWRGSACKVQMQLPPGLKQEMEKILPLCTWGYPYLSDTLPH